MKTKGYVRLIRRWGKDVTSHVDTSVDFVREDSEEGKVELM
jgi:hypothetical protein